MTSGASPDDEKGRSSAKDDGDPSDKDPKDAGEGAGASKDEVSARGLKIANGFLWFVAALFAMNLFFSLHMHRHTALSVAAAIGLALMIAVRLRAKPSHRVSVVLVLVPAMLAVGGFEFMMGRRRPRDGTAALQRGLTFDSRGLFEVVHDMQKKDATVQSFMIPRALLTHNLNAPRWADEAIAHTVRPDWGVKVDGVQTLPFAGVSNRTTVFCNEGGYWAVYDSDEHGFNNPKGIWGAPPLDVAILGDSYSQGACVPQNKITAAFVRKKFPKTLTFGMCANGPLMEYADFREFVTELKPKVVLWVYYNNDLSDMNVETQSELLMRYVNDDTFKQNLASRQAGVDKALDDYLNAFGPTAPAWPSALGSVGLTRESTPLFLQDVVMREGHSSFAAFLRLDWFTNAISTRLLEKNFFAAEPRWDLFKKVLTKTRETTESWGGKAYFVYLPDAFYMSKKVKMEEPNRKGVLQAAHDAGMKVIDVHEVFMALPDPEKMRPHYEAHFTEEGFELVGKTINDALTADGL
ncbi:MAG: phage holin family protein [Polyangiaceae bacterium]